MADDVNSTGIKAYNEMGKSPGEMAVKNLETISPENAPGLYGLSDEEADDLKLMNLLQNLGVDDPWNPTNFYDYESAILAGDLPNETGQWSPKHRHDLHPDRFIKGGDNTQFPGMEFYDTKYNRPASSEDIASSTLLRDQFLEDSGIIPEVSEKKSNIMEKIIGGANNGS